jgi:hypothetical protein
VLRFINTATYSFVPPGAKGRSGGFLAAACGAEAKECLERNGSERAKVASVAERKPPASTWR